MFYGVFDQLENFCIYNLLNNHCRKIVDDKLPYQFDQISVKFVFICFNSEVTELADIYTIKTTHVMYVMPGKSIHLIFHSKQILNTRIEFNPCTGLHSTPYKTTTVNVLILIALSPTLISLVTKTIVIRDH